MSTQQEQLRPWADRDRPAGHLAGNSDGGGYEEQVAALFRRVDVAVHFNPERVALAVLAHRSAPPRLRYAMVGAAVLLLSSAGAVAAVRRAPRLALWLMTITSTPPRMRPAETDVAERVAQPALPAPSDLPAPSEPVAVAVEQPTVRSGGSVGSVGRAHRRLALDRRATRTRQPRTLLAAAPEPNLEASPLEAAPPLEIPELPGPPSPAVAPPTPAVAAPAPESQLARESRLLQRAYAQLRTRDDPSGALDTLDEYLSAHPLGLLRKEATSARIESLHKLKRSDEALSALRTFPFGEGARDAELRVLRGELSAAKDCLDALPDFVAVSDKVVPEDVLERALYGRAACEARLGQRAQAVSSFRAYLRQFPAGRFAAEARRQTGEEAK